jgi:hypothetical protein
MQAHGPRDDGAAALPPAPTLAMPPPAAASEARGDDDLDAMMEQIEIDQQNGQHGLPWSDSAEGTYAWHTPRLSRSGGRSQLRCCRVSRAASPLRARPLTADATVPH